MSSHVHETHVDFDGTMFYWWCKFNGCTTTTDNAYSTRTEALEFANEHERKMSGAVYVLTDSFKKFENVCRVDWRDNPRDPRYVVFYCGNDQRKLLSRTWQDNDEIRVIGWPLPYLREMFVSMMRRMGAPDDELLKVR